MTSEPLPGCALGLSVDDLSAWRDGALDGAATARLNAHIAGCAACRARLAEYDVIAQGLRAIPTPMPTHGYGRNPRVAGAAPTPRPRPARRAPIGRRQALGGLGAIAAVALLLLAFIQVFGRLGAQTPTAAATSTPTLLATATTPATATVAPTATATALPTTTVAASACGKYFPYTATLTPVNGLVVTQYSSLGTIAYPSTQIPSNQPAAPMQAPVVTLTSPNYIPGYAPNTTPVINPRPGIGGGYVLDICNPSNQAHTISAVRVSLAKMTPFTDQLSAWEMCHDGFYSPLAKSVISGGCGGSDLRDEYLQAAFAANAPVGSAVTATQVRSNTPDMTGDGVFGPLPISLQPGHMMTIEVAVTPPSAEGYYTFAFALTVDGANTGTVAYSLMTLIAPVAHEWGGAACTTSAMQALIAKEPPPTASTEYICPPS